MSARNELLQSLSHTISDYRQGEIRPITPEHVERWLSQFEESDQMIILAEMDLLMKRFYFSSSQMKECLRQFLKMDLIRHHNPVNVLPHIQFLQNQTKGNSQKILLDCVDEILYEEYQFRLAQCGTKQPNIYVYIDDGIYTGNKLIYDLFKGESAWINGVASKSSLLIYTVVAHTTGVNYVEEHVEEASQKKELMVRRYQSLIIDNRHLANSKVEFLWPELVQGDEYVDAYISQLRVTSASRGWSERNLFRLQKIPKQEIFFSSPESRGIVERAFLSKGTKIITGFRRSAQSVRPLGFEKLESLGFGTLWVSYRNISNNCPLVLWWGEPDMPATQPLGRWYPLFPRVTNMQYNEY